MSLIGIDVGSSSVKVTAYSEEGKYLAEVNNPLTPLYPQPGLWEQSPSEIWEATSLGMKELMTRDALRKDPPKAIAISASGRENFLADAGGNPLSNGVMGADIRGAEFDIPPDGSSIPEPWCTSCGHLRERMDPIFRLMWWRKNHPELVDKAKYFLGWHDFLSMQISGRIATDRSTASRYLTYDLTSNGWNPERVAEYELQLDFLPEVLPWPSVIGKVKKEVVEDWGMSPEVQLTLGGHDVNCAAVGAGVSEPGVACLISGSYENLLVMTSTPPTPDMLLKGLSVMPHPGEASYSALAVCPTGNAVLNWSRALLGVSTEEIETIVAERDLGPSPVLAIPYLSGSMMHWENGRKAKGALIGMTLATTQADTVQAFMESIAYDHVNTFDLLKNEGVNVERIRAVGGGTRSVWWTQLKADLTQIPIEIVEQQEAGTLGAAILAGLAIGVYRDLKEVSKNLSGTKGIFEPDLTRLDIHKDRLYLYQKMIPTLISTAFDSWE